MHNGEIFKLYNQFSEGNSVPLLVNCGHSGRDYTSFRANDLDCELDRLRLLEDTLMDIICNLPQLGDHGITALEALFPRSLIDPNRSETSLDSSQIREWTGEKGLRCIPDTYTAVGSGLVPIAAKVEGVSIYKAGHEPTETDVAQRLDKYKAYHSVLGETLSDMFNRHGGYALLDMHSCAPYGAPDNVGVQEKRADIILSNRNGISCSADFMNVVKKAYEEEGFSNISINSPFLGGFIVDRYGQHNSANGEKCQALQVEINKAIYFRPNSYLPCPEDIAHLQQVNRRVFCDVSSYMESLLK